MKVEPGNILKLFLYFSNFEPQYSYRLYSYKKMSVVEYCRIGSKLDDATSHSIVDFVVIEQHGFISPCHSINYVIYRRWKTFISMQRSIKQENYLQNFEIKRHL